MDKTYIGIDPGQKGAIAIIRPNSEVEFHSLADHDMYSLSDLFYEISSANPSRFCVIEDVRALHGASSVSTFNFGLAKGMLLALLCATRTPFELVPPQRWQKFVWTSSDLEYLPIKDGKRKIDTKQSTINAAKRIFPTADLRRTPKCKTPDDGLADALMMAEYGRRNNL